MKTPAYFRARLALIDDFIRETPDNGQKNNDHVLLRNGLMPANLLHGKSETVIVNEKLKTENYSNEPLTFSEKCKWNTWFAMYPEKVAGTEIVTTSFEFPITIKGDKEDIIDVLTPVIPDSKPKKTLKMTKKEQPTYNNLKKIMPVHQKKIVFDEPELKDVLEKLELVVKSMPKLGETEDQTIDNVFVYLHYFYAESDWFITEWSRKENMFFGYVILNGDSQMSEFGYISVDELTHTQPIELDLYWRNKTLSEALYDSDPDYFKKPENKQEVSKEKQLRIRIAKAKAIAMLKLLELENDKN